MMVRDRWPDQVVHLSVQANVVNYAAVQNFGTAKALAGLFCRESFRSKK